MRIERLKHIAGIRVSNVDKKTVEGQTAVKLCNYTDVYYNERITAALDFMEATATKDQCKIFGLRVGDVLLTKDSETADDIGVSALVDEDVPNLVCGYHLAVVRPRADIAYGPYVHWALASDIARQSMAAAATGVTRFGLRAEAIADLDVPLPPLSSQRSIAGYLDRETARIDALIAAKRRMVKLFEARSESLREEAFKSIDAPPVALGRFIRSIGQGVSPEAESRSIEGDEWGVLKLSAVKHGRFVPSEHKALSVDFRPDRDLVPRAGDLLVTRANTPELVGDVCAVTTTNPRVMLCDLIYRLRLDQGLDPEYAAQALLTQNARYQLSSRARGTSQSMVKLRGEDIKCVSLPVPALDSQRDVVSKLSTANSRIELINSRLMNSIWLLSERRQTLITAAVIGQLDISKAA